MRKLRPEEEYALMLIREQGGFCPGSDWGSPLMIRILKSLVRKGQVRVEGTDDGPRYTAVPE